MWSPRPTSRAISAPIATWSPVTILTWTPRSRASAIVAAESTRGGSDRGSTPTSCHLPSSSVRATDRERKPRSANRCTRSWAASITSLGGHRAATTCGAPFVIRASLPSAPRATASVRLVTGSKGVKATTWEAGRARSPLARRTARSIGSPSSAREASAAADSTSAPATPGTHHGSPTTSRFWVSVPVLSEHRTSTPPSSSTAGRWLTTTSRRASSRAPTAMVTDRTAGSATGTEAMVTTSANPRVCRSELPRATDTTNVTVTSTRVMPIR